MTYNPTQRAAQRAANLATLRHLRAALPRWRYFYTRAEGTAPVDRDGQQLREPGTRQHAWHSPDFAASVRYWPDTGRVVAYDRNGTALVFDPHRSDGDGWTLAKVLRVLATLTMIPPRRVTEALAYGETVRLHVVNNPPNLALFSAAEAQTPARRTGADDALFTLDS